MISKLFGICFPFLRKFSKTLNASQYYDINTKDDHIYLTPKKDHQATLIWVYQNMHGLGDTAQSYLELFTEQNNELVFQPNIKLVLLQAPERKVTINFGEKMPSWFDIRDVNFNVDPAAFSHLVSVEEIEQSLFEISNIIDEESVSVGSDRVFVGGFSQGGSMALHAGLSYDQTLGGIIGFSGFLFPHTKINPRNRETPTYVSHGEEDYVVPCQLAKESYQILKEKLTRVDIQIIPKMEHEITEKQLIQARKLIENRIREIELQSENSDRQFDQIQKEEKQNLKV